MYIPVYPCMCMSWTIPTSADQEDLAEQRLIPATGFRGSPAPSASLQAQHLSLRLLLPIAKDHRARASFCFGDIVRLFLLSGSYMSKLLC